MSDKSLSGEKLKKDAKGTGLYLKTMVKWSFFALIVGGICGTIGVACAVSHLVSGYSSLYSSQKIMYSKVEPHLRQ